VKGFPWGKEKSLKKGGVTRKEPKKEVTTNVGTAEGKLQR